MPPQFSDVIQNIENCCVILTHVCHVDNNQHRQTGVQIAQQFSIFWITPMTKYIIGEIFSSGGPTLYKNPSDQTVIYIGYNEKTCDNFFLETL